MAKIVLSLVSLLLVFRVHAQAPASFGARYALIIGGIGGLESYTEKYFEQTSRMYNILIDTLGYKAERIIYIAERPDMDSTRIDMSANAENVRKAFTRLASDMQAQDQLFVFMVGHGSFAGYWSRFNLRGPDLRDIDFVPLFSQLPTQRIILVNTSSSSGPFIEKLSHEERVIITATKNGAQRYETNFADFFLNALSSEGTDSNKDGRISMVEAFTFAKKRQDRWFEENNRLRSEHPMLDDNGDGVGSLELQNSEDGLWASRMYINGLSDELEASLRRAGAGTLSEADSLRLEQRATEEEIADLKARKAQMEPQAYSQRLEVLLIRLARINRRITRLEGGENE